MADTEERAASRFDPGDVESATRYVRQLIRNGNAEETLGKALAGQLCELRSRMLLHCAESFEFWGQIDDVPFNVIVSRAAADDGGWNLFKEDPNVIRPFPKPSSASFILSEHDVMPFGWAWRRFTAVGDWTWVEYADVYDAVLVALDLCDVRRNPPEHRE